MFTCDQCERSVEAEPHETVTGRQLCDPCNDLLLGLAAGVVAAGPSADIGDQVVAGLATAGWFARLRARRRSDGHRG